MKGNERERSFSLFTHIEKTMVCKSERMLKKLTD